MNRLLRFALMLLLSGFATQALALMEEFMKLDPKATAILKTVDWGQATTIEVLLADHDYSPNQLVFAQGKPYILKLRNVGAQAHDMVGGSFFQAIVVRMTNAPSGRIVTPYLKSIYIRSQQEMEIWFVPTRTGSFTFFCSLPGHRESGMEGEVEIR